MKILLTRTSFVRLSLLLIAALITGCGFHLVGGRDLPVQLKEFSLETAQKYKVAEPPLETALRSRLTVRGADVRSRQKADRPHLLLSNLRERREILSIGADGKALEFRLTTTVKYQFSVNGKPLLPADELSVMRDYSFNAEQLLAKEAEEARLRSFMQDELAQLLILRIEALLGNFEFAG